MPSLHEGISLSLVETTAVGTVLVVVSPTEVGEDAVILVQSTSDTVAQELLTVTPSDPAVQGLVRISGSALLLA